MPQSVNLGEFEQLVLFAMLRLTTAGGIAIHDEIEARTGRDVSPGAIYTTLGRLEARGLVAMVDASPSQGRIGRPRKSYVLTQRGARALHTSYGNLRAMADEHLTRLVALTRK